MVKDTYGVRRFRNDNIFKGKARVVDNLLGDLGENQEQDNGYQDGNQDHGNDHANDPKAPALVERGSSGLDNFVMLVKLIIFSLVLSVREIAIHHIWGSSVALSH